MRKTICLLFLITPIHAISSICAVKTLHDTNEVETILIIHNPSLTEEIMQEVADIIQSMVQNIPFITKFITLSQSEFINYLSLPIDKAQTEFKNNFLMHEIDELYYAHDVGIDLYPFLCKTFPNATRICFGDSLGQVFEKDIHLSFLIKDINIKKKKLSPIKKIILNVTKICNRNHENTDLSHEYRAHKAALILPIDQSGSYLKKVPLTICTRKTALDLITKYSESNKELKLYISELLYKYRDKKKLLLLTENHTEGNFIDFEREIMMWCSIIRENCNHGDIIFLKSHPGETLPRNEKITEVLGNVFEIVELDKQYKRYPIELWHDLVINCKIICPSFPILSLKYLYNIDVVQPMTDAFIEKWFPEWTWASYKNSLSLYMEPLKNLAEWDGESVLYSGDSNKGK